MLSGKTGLAFRFVIHKRLLPSSVDAYNWGWENWKHVNTLGIYSEYYEGKLNNPAFVLYQDAAIEKIRTSIDNGFGVIAWGMSSSQFGVIYGYDDRDQVFYFKNPGDVEDNIMLYKNFGIITEGSWYYQIFGKKIDKDIRDIYRDSLLIAVQEWENQYKLDSSYGSGRMAYEYLISALENQDLNEAGAYYILPLYSMSKCEIYEYLSEVIKELPEISGAANKYLKLKEIYQNILKLPLSMMFDKDKKYIPQLVEYFKQARETEKAGINELKLFLKETLNNVHINPERLKDL
ncbi:MAG: hypothetical protein N3I35_13070 [Clostridia bacterium]|nr:hypothetical protein [Clostridia bacterium]